jgi:hypothetical protein
MEFKLSIQRAHHERKQSDDTPNADPQAILAAFDGFGWLEEVARANELQRVSPTLSIAEGGRLIWVSGVGDMSQVEFVSDYRFPRHLFGLFKYNETVSATKALDTVRARRAIELFLNGAHEDLLRLYRAA